MRMKLRARGIAGAVMTLLTSAVSCSAPGFETGRLGAVHVLAAEGDVRGLVFLFSSEQGWSATEAEAATRLAERGAIVVGVDLPAYRTALDGSEGECLYLVSEVESLSQQVQRQFRLKTYRSPVLAGIGEGGALARAMLAQTPAATVAGAVVVDPGEAIRTRLPLCPGAPSRRAAQGFIYDTAPVLHGFLSIGFSPAAGAAGREHARHVLEDGEPGTIESEPSATSTAPWPAASENSPALLARLVDIHLANLDRGDSALSSSLVEMPADAPGRALVIVLSGDGGWRDLDKTIAEGMHDAGLGVVGWDSLRYFWHEKSPERVAADLDSVIARYSREWKSGAVALVGYSFGADVLPFAYNRLSDESRAKVRQVSLLGFSASADFEFHVSAWLGASRSAEARPNRDELARMPASLMQCFYGEEEDDSACPQLEDGGIEVIRTTGGHHFDRDYPALARRILEGLARRT